MMRTKYTIKVERVRDVEGVLGPKWEIVGVGDDGRNKYGYTPVLDTIIKEEETIYEQTVDSLDMAALVEVVNGLNRP